MLIEVDLLEEDIVLGGLVSEKKRTWVLPASRFKEHAA